MTGSVGLGQMTNAADGTSAITSAATRTRSICRAVLRECVARGWAPLVEVALANGRRADILTLLPDGEFAVIEVKSGAADFLSDTKWPEYRLFCDRFYFAIDADFPRLLLPPETGVLVVEPPEVAMLRPAPLHKLAPARRRALLHRFATLAAARLFALTDPAAAARGGARPD